MYFHFEDLSGRKSEKNSTNYLSEFRASMQTSFQTFSILRSILNQFIDKFQDSIVGKNCNVTYDIMEQTDDVDFVTLTKVFTLDECEDVALIRDAIFTLEGQRKRTPFLQSSLVTKMNVTESEKQFFIHELVSEGRYATLTNMGAKTEHIVYTRYLNVFCFRF